MRIRYNPEARPELAAWEYYINEPETLRGHWAEAFARRQPMELELGCGKGGFIAQLAPQHPEKNYVALDLKSEMLVLAKRKIEEAYAGSNRPIDNILMTAVDIERIFLIMDAHDRFDAIYINFCPPCSKSRSHKHRLTHPKQLERYRVLLAEGGRLCFKTDDDDLFLATLGYLAEDGWEIDYCTHDLHRDGAPMESPATEHEMMFSAEGIPTKYLIAHPRPCTGDAQGEKV